MKFMKKLNSSDTIHVTEYNKRTITTEVETITPLRAAPRLPTLLILNSYKLSYNLLNNSVENVVTIRKLSADFSIIIVIVKKVIRYIHGEHHPISARYYYLGYKLANAQCISIFFNLTTKR